MKKKWGIPALVLLSIFLAVSGCSGAKNDQPVKSTNDNISGGATTLTVVYIQMGNTPPDIDQVVNEINKISYTKINATIKLVGIPISNFIQQVRLMMASQEDMDLLVTGGLPFMDFSGQTSNGQLLALNDLLDKQGIGIQSVVESYLKAGTIKGNIYGIPTLRDEAKAPGFAIRKDLVEKYQIDITKIKKLEDIEPILKTLKENEPNLAPFFTAQEATMGIDLGMHLPGGDSLGDNNYFSGVLMDAKDTTLKAVNYYETAEYATLLKLIRKWNQAGYLLPNAITNSTGAYSLVKFNKLASFIQDVKPGIENQLTQAIGKEMVVVPLANAVSYTNVVNAYMWSIPKQSKKAEKAMEFLNLMYTDSDIINLLDWGIEGKHYVKTNDGNIDYPSGINASNTGYGPNTGFMYGNQLLSHVWKGDPTNLWQQMKMFNDSAVRSEAFGFTFDITPVKNEYVECLDVYRQYGKVLGVGEVDPDNKLPEFIAKLKAAGVDKIVAEKQRQVNEWAKDSR